MLKCIISLMAFFDHYGSQHSNLKVKRCLGWKCCWKIIRIIHPWSLRIIFKYLMLTYVLILWTWLFLFPCNFCILHANQTNATISLWQQIMWITNFMATATFFAHKISTCCCQEKLCNLFLNFFWLYEK